MEKHEKADSTPFRGDQLTFSSSPFISPRFATDKWSKKRQKHGFGAHFSGFEEYLMAFETFSNL